MSKERLDNSVLDNAISVYKTFLEVVGDIADEEHSSVLDKVTLVFLEELKQYRDLEEQGLLLRLPCKVGDMVYTVCSWGIESGVVGSIEIISDRVFVNNIHGAMIGEAQNIFLTQSEAEEKLRELEGK